MWRDASVSITGLEEPEQVQAMRLTHTTLPILRVRAATGRIFNQQDDSPGTPLTVVLAHGFWQTRFGGDPDVIGQTLTVDGQSHEIIGVLPADVQFLDHDPAIYLPFRFDSETLVLGNWSYPALARLRPGVTIEQANADVKRMIPLAVKRFPGGMTQSVLDEAGLAPLVRPLKEDVVGDVKNVLWVLLGTVGVVLLIACANVANLFLVRANERGTEVAIRTAMGASRGALASQFLTESIVLGLLGGAGGLTLAYGGVNLLHSLAPEGLPRLDQIAIRPVVLLFTLGLALLTGLLFGLVPVLRSGHNPAGALKEDGGRSGGASKGRGRVRDALVVAQVALALVLLVGAGLMMRSLLALSAVRPGFERPEEVLTVGVNIPSAEVREPELVALSHEQMLRNLEAIPGVTSVGASSSVTMDGQINNNSLFFDGFPVPEGQIPPQVRHKWVLPGYFETMQNILLAGRSISWADIHARAPVAVITENVAVEYWGSAASAIGRRVRETSNDDRPWREIVGVVGDIRDDGLSEGPVRTVYWPAINEQFRGRETMVSRTMTFVIRTPRLHTAGFMDEISAAIWAVNPNVPLANIHTLRKILDRSMARTSFAVVMLMIASAAALLLGVVGIYGVTSYAVAQRRHELGVRMAIGAQRGDISRLVLRHTLVLAAAGAAAGVTMAVGLTQLMSALLYGVSAIDPLTFIVMTIFVGGTAMLATWIPARRAARVNPMTALRME